MSEMIDHEALDTVLRTLETWHKEASDKAENGQETGRAYQRGLAMAYHDSIRLVRMARQAHTAPPDPPTPLWPAHTSPWSIADEDGELQPIDLIEPVELGSAPHWPAEQAMLLNAAEELWRHWRNTQPLAPYSTLQVRQGAGPHSYHITMEVRRESSALGDGAGAQGDAGGHGVAEEEPDAHD